MKKILVFIVINLLYTLYGKTQDPAISIDPKLVKELNRDSLNFGDLHFLNDILKNKRIVLLGEFSHGVKEVNILKNKIIRYLHENLQYDVLLMETGMAEMNMINFYRSGTTVNRQLNASMMGPWRTYEHQDLLTYLKDKNDWTIAGFDVQKSGSSFSLFVQRIFSPIDSLVGSQLAETEKLNDSLMRVIQRGDANADIPSFKSEVEQRYKKFLELSVVSKDKWMAKDMGKAVLDMINRSVENRIAYLNYYPRVKNQMAARFYKRDSVMAANLIWLLSKQYPEKKAIIIAHNYHISKYNEHDNVMGEALYEKFGDQLYGIGMFAASGNYADNTRKPKALMDPVTNDLKTIILSQTPEIGFIDISKDSKKIFNIPLTVNDSFTDLSGTNMINLQKSFDGLLFIKKVSPAVYVQ